MVVYTGRIGVDSRVDGLYMAVYTVVYTYKVRLQGRVRSLRSFTATIRQV